MKKLIGIMMAAIVFAGLGCASQQVPKSKISFPMPGGQSTLDLPKNSDITGFKMLITSATNTIQVSIDHLVAKNDADVIAASGAATGEAFKAFGDSMIAMAQTGAQIAAKAALAGAKAPTNAPPVQP